MGGSSAQPRGSRYFFQHLASKVELDRLEPHTITAQDDRVVVEGSNRRTVRATGVSFEHEWVMVFTVREGKITRMRHYYDPAEILPAFRDA